MATNYLAEGARRAAQVLVATLGASRVQLQIASPPIAGDDGEELGLRTPVFQTETLAPVAIRQVTQNTEVLVAAGTLEAVLGVEGSGAIATAMLTVTGVHIFDLMYVATGIQEISVGSRDVLYRLLLRLPGTEVV